MVGATDEWAGFDMDKTHCKAFLFQQGKLVWTIESGYGQMLSRRLEVLANGDDVTIGRPKISQYFACLIERLPHAENQA